MDSGVQGLEYFTENLRGGTLVAHQECAHMLKVTSGMAHKGGDSRALIGVHLFCLSMPSPNLIGPLKVAAGEHRSHRW